MATKRFRKGFTGQLANEVEEAVCSVAEKYGMAANVNSARANKGVVTIALRISTKNADGLTYEQSQFQLFSSRYDIPANWLGRKLSISTDLNRIFEVYGWNQRSKKYKVLLMDQEGALMKMSPDLLKDNSFIKWVEE